MMRKYLQFVLIIALLLLVNIKSAQSEPLMQVNNYNEYSGSIISVPVNIINECTTAGSFKITYDHNYLLPINVKEGELSGEKALVANLEHTFDDYTNVAFACSTSSANDSLNICTVDFLLLKPGDTAVSISNMKTYAENGSTVQSVENEVLSNVHIIRVINSDKNALENSDDDNLFNEAIDEQKGLTISLDNRKNKLVRVNPINLIRLAGAEQRITIMNKGIQIEFGQNSLITDDILNSIGQESVIELGVEYITEEEKRELLLNSNNSQNMSLIDIGGRLIKLTARICNGTNCKQIAFTEPVKVTVDLSEVDFSQEISNNLTAVKYVKIADRLVKTTKIGGEFDTKTKCFSFYTNSFSVYGISKVAVLNKLILFTNRNSSIINGKEEIIDVLPFISNGCVMLPIRFVGENLGAAVNWESATMTVEIEIDDKIILLHADNTKAGPEEAVIIKNRAFMPIGYVSEKLGAYIVWFPQNNEIRICK